MVRVFGEDVALSEREMLRRADEALYQAKAEGRDRTVLTMPPDMVVVAPKWAETLGLRVPE